jgi:ABC-type proline/glycine betaine transport system permease subunit
MAPAFPSFALLNPLLAGTEFLVRSLLLGRKEEHRMTGLGILLLIVGLILWLTVMPAIGWILMAIGVVLIVVGLVLGMAWGFSRRTAPY